jgi:hypothetical protein
MSPVQTAMLREEPFTLGLPTLIMMPNFEWRVKLMRTVPKESKAFIRSIGMTHNIMMAARIGKLCNKTTRMVPHTNQGRPCHPRISNQHGEIQHRIIMRPRTGNMTIEVTGTNTTIKHSLVTTSD